MKIIFMGTPDFAVPCLMKMIKMGHDILAVVTQPDRPKGRGKKMTPPPTKVTAIEHSIPVFQPERVRDEKFISKLKAFSPDCIVVVAFGQILPKEILDMPPMGCINVHASLLPKYRGAAPINWSIIKGEKITGVTTMYMDEGLDTGDMILKKEILIKDKTAGELHDVLSAAGAQLLLETLEQIESGEAPREKQDQKESSYAPLMDKSLGNIDWKDTAENIYNLIRGVNPWPTAFTTYKGEKFKIWRSKVLQEACTKKPGTVLKVNNQGIYVSTGSEILVLEEIQFPNSRRMTVDAYLRGNKIEESIVLGE